MSDTLRKVSVYSAVEHGDRGSVQADLMLPSDCALGELIPSIVTATVGAAEAGPLRWQLSRVGGGHLDNSRSLREHEVRDGELLLLSTARVPSPQYLSGDACGAITAAADQSTLEVDRVAAWAGLVVCAVSAAALLVSGATVSAAPWIAGALSAAAAAAAVASTRSGTGSAVALGSASVVFAATAGCRAVPQAPWAATLLLMASAGLAMSVLMLRTACRTSATLGALATLTGAVTVVAAACAMTTPSKPAAGAALTVLALVALASAPRLTVAVTGIGPPRNDIDGEQAKSAHRVLTGLVAGFAAAAALGAAAVAVTACAALRSCHLAVLFASIVGVLLLLRQRTHTDRQRRIALCVTGFTALAAAVAMSVVAIPEHGIWAAAAGGAAGLATACWPLSRGCATPVTGQVIQALEYSLLAAALPLAAWVSGLYGLVRDLSLL